MGPESPGHGAEERPRWRARRRGSGPRSAPRSGGTWPASTSHETTGTLSEERMGVPQAGQNDPGLHDRQATGDPVDHDVQERSDDEPEHHGRNTVTETRAPAAAATPRVRASNCASDQGKGHEVPAHSQGGHASTATSGALVRRAGVP